MVGNCCVGLRLGAADYCRGLVDAVAFWRMRRLFRDVPEVGTSVWMITGYSLVLLLGQLVIEWGVLPTVAHSVGLAAAEWFLYITWSLPALVLGAILNVWHFHTLCSAITDSVQHPSTPQAGNSSARVLVGLRQAIWAIAEEILRLLVLLIVASAAQHLVFRASLVWFAGVWFWDIGLRLCVRFICFSYLAWVHALNAFDYAWATLSTPPPMVWKLCQVELRPAYFLGFGSWIAACLVFFPSYAGTPLSYAMVPWLVVAAVMRPIHHAPFTEETARWPLFTPFLPIASFAMAAAVRIYVVLSRCTKFRPMV